MCLIYVVLLCCTVSFFVFLHHLGPREKILRSAVYFVCGWMAIKLTWTWTDSYSTTIKNKNKIKLKNVVDTNSTNIFKENNNIIKYY